MKKLKDILLGLTNYKRSLICKTCLKTHQTLIKNLPTELQITVIA